MKVLKMTQKKIEIHICIDEHGNYNAMGSSKITEENKHQAIAIIEEDIKVDEIATTTTSFKVNIELPEPNK